MAKTAGLWVLFTAIAMCMSLGLTLLLDLDSGASFLVGLLCGTPAGFGAVAIGFEKGWL